VDIAIVLNLLSAVGGLGGLATVIGIAYWLGKKFSEIDYRFRLVDERFNAINERFRLIDERFKVIDARFEQVDRRFDELRGYVDKRIDDLKNYVDKRFGELKDYVGTKFSEFDVKWSSRLERLATAFTNYQEFFIEFLTTESVIEERYRGVLLKELRGVMRLAVANPLSKEEWARLKELFEKSEKNELTLEEADEFLELARKAALEHGENPKMWKLHIYATITRALLYKKYYEKKEEAKEAKQEVQK
jgi:tetrahydromethanopterin S-methyltransferase subunit G